MLFAYKHARHASHPSHGTPHTLFQMEKTCSGTGRMLFLIQGLNFNLHQQDIVYEYLLGTSTGSKACAPRRKLIESKKRQILQREITPGIPSYGLHLVHRIKGYETHFIKKNFLSVTSGNSSTSESNLSSRALNLSWLSFPFINYISVAMVMDTMRKISNNSAATGHS
jgi:hypothetical protein